MSERLDKLTEEDKHIYLAAIVKRYFPGCICEVRKNGRSFAIYIKQGIVEDFLPMPKSIEEFQRYLHTFSRFSAKWNNRGIAITLDRWNK